MKFSRRSFLKTGTTAILASLFPAKVVRPVKASALPSILPGKEIAARCPLCSLGCGLIYRFLGTGNWHVEGDPDCPVAFGSLCSRGAGLAGSLISEQNAKPLYRAPGSEDFEVIDWQSAVDLLARRLKDLRDRDLGFFSVEGEKISNRFDSLGVIAGGCLTNEEAYVVSKFFRAMGVSGLDTTVRASHGMAVSGLLDVLGLPGATHPVTQPAHSDVVVLLGCNPGQTAPALCRFLDDVRKRRGIVIVIDPRRSETMKKDDLWLRIRPGTDIAILGAFMQWILQHAQVPLSELVERTDAPYTVMSEIMGAYERHTSGKYKNWIKVDETLTEPYSVFQRMKKHFKRYSIDKVAGISGVDVHLLRRACTLLARTATPDFSAVFIVGSGALASPSGADTMRLAASIQAVLGNLDKKGGGITLPTAAANAQGVCDMGLLSPYLPGYLQLPLYGEDLKDHDQREPMEALLRTWYPLTDTGKAWTYMPNLEADENPNINTIIQNIGDERYRAVVAIGSDPLNSLPDNSSILNILDRLDLLVVMDSALNRTSNFFKHLSRNESGIKTEVIYIPTEPPILKSGSMTDTGRRSRSLEPVEISNHKAPGLLNFMIELGNSVRTKYKSEGGVFPEPVTDLGWPLSQEPFEVALEVNGWRSASEPETLLPPGKSWMKEDRCGNYLYRGWVDKDGWLVKRRDNGDAYQLRLYESWGWFWPWGIADPFSWVGELKTTRGTFLRWKAQSGIELSAADTLPIRPQLPVKFWRVVDKDSPFPEHYEPFHSPLPDFLTGGLSNPSIGLRSENGRSKSYLYRRPDEELNNYPVIITMHRTGNIMGTGGITSRLDHARELGICRIVEIGKDLAQALRVANGDRVVITSPYNIKGVEAAALVTGRIASFERDSLSHHVASLTLYGYGDEGANTLTPPAFDFLSGGMEVKVFMGLIEKAKI